MNCYGRVSGLLHFFVTRGVIHMEMSVNDVFYGVHAPTSSPFEDGIRGASGVDHDPFAGRLIAEDVTKNLESADFNLFNDHLFSRDEEVLEKLSDPRQSQGLISASLPKGACEERREERTGAVLKQKLST
jgi:hypothetical protein